jgi:hypothetical protein
MLCSLTHDFIQIPISLVGAYCCYSCACGMFTPPGRGARRGIEDRDYYWSAIATRWQTLNRSRICPAKSSVGRTIISSPSQPKHSTVDFPAPSAPTNPDSYSFVTGMDGNSIGWGMDFPRILPTSPTSLSEAQATKSGMVYTSLAQVFWSRLIVRNFPLAGGASRLRRSILSSWGKMCRKKQNYI